MLISDKGIHSAAVPVRIAGTGDESIITPILPIVHFEDDRSPVGSMPDIGLLIDPGKTGQPLPVHMVASDVVDIKIGITQRSDVMKKMGSVGRFSMNQRVYGLDNSADTVNIAPTDRNTEPVIGRSPSPGADEDIFSTGIYQRCIDFGNLPCYFNCARRVANWALAVESAEKSMANSSSTGHPIASRPSSSRAVMIFGLFALDFAARAICRRVNGA